MILFPNVVARTVEALVIYVQECHHVETTFVIKFKEKHICPRNQSLGPLKSVHYCQMLKHHKKKEPVKVFLHVPHQTFTN